MLIRFLEGVGLKTINHILDMKKTLFFTFSLIRSVVKPQNYTVSSVEVLVKQIYFTSIQVLPSYLFLASILGAVLVGGMVSVLIGLGLKDAIGSTIVNVLINEIIPFVTVLLLALRSGTAMTTEMAVMNVSKEMNTLRYFNIQPLQYLFVPRVVNGVVSMFLLSTMFTVVALLSGYICLALVMHMGLSLYIGSLVEAFGAVELFVFLFKAFFFGYFVAAIPVYRGNKPLTTYNAIPIAVLQGMVKLFMAILLIEVISFLRFL